MTSAFAYDLRPSIDSVPSAAEATEPQQGRCQSVEVNLLDLPADVIDLFWSKVAKSAPVHPTRPEMGRCWSWRGTRTKRNSRRHKGYGLFHVRGHYSGLAHRLSYALHVGYMPPGWVLHTCDRPWCVNPEHLYEGTPRDNSWDCHERNRAKRRPTRSATGYRGVYAKHSPRARLPYSATIAIRGRTVYLGSYLTAEDAARAYDLAAVKYQAADYGIDFVRLNFPEEWGL